MSEERSKLKWPWFILAALVFGILLAILWMTREVENVRRIRSSTSGQTSGVMPPGAGRPPAPAGQGHGGRTFQDERSAALRERRTI